MGVILVISYLVMFIMWSSGSAPLSLMCFIFWLIGQGCHGMYTVAMGTNVRNTPFLFRGKVCRNGI
jgi:hypothetical protein